MRALLAVAVLVVALELPELDAGTFTAQVLIQEQLRAQPPHATIWDLTGGRAAFCGRSF